MRRFFVKPEQIGENEIVLTGEDVHHIAHVLRMKPGDPLTVSAQDGWEYACRITRMSDSAVTAAIEDISKGASELPSKITLFQCLPKSGKMEWILQKAVELGVYAVVPVAASRCVTRLNEKKAEAKTRRWQEIAESAAKQSRRLVIPQVHPVVSFAEALKLAGTLDVRLLPYECAEGMERTRRLLSAIRPGESVGVLIGPEGGFSKEEAEAAQKDGFAALTLGGRILRTETAGLCVLSMLLYCLEGEK